MAKPSSNNSTSNLADAFGLSSKEEEKLDILEETAIDSGSKPLYNKSSGVRIRSLYDARLEYRGQVSGKLYIWNKAGDTTEVLTEDSALLLAKRLGGKQCCGDSKDGNVVFEIAN